MALKLTPKQTKSLIDALNKDYKKDAKEARVELRDFYDADGIPWTLDEVQKKISTAPAPKALVKKDPEPGQELEEKKPEEESPQKDMFKEKGVSTKNTPLAVWQQVDHVLGPEKFENFISPHVKSDLAPKPSKDAFKSIEASATKEISISVSGYDLVDHYPGFEKEKDKKGDILHRTFNSSTLLQAMNAAERKAFLAKLDFEATWKQYSDKSGWALFAQVPMKKTYLNLTFDTAGFLKQSQLRLSRDGQVVDKEDLIEKLATFFDLVGKQEEEHGNDEDQLADSYGGYAEEDAKNNSLQDMKRNLESEIETYVDRLVSLGVDEDQIKEALVESGDSEFTTGYRSTTNSIGSSGCPSEDEIDFDSYSNERYEDLMAEAGLPDPKNIDANLAFLNKEDIDALKNKISDMSVDFKWDNSIDGYSAQHGTVSFGDDRRFDWVVDEHKFISKAKRLIKDAKLAKRGTQKKVASLSSYETVTEVLKEPSLYPTVEAALK